MVFWGENSPSSLHKKWREVTQNDSFLIVINLIYNIVIFQGQNRAENRKEFAALFKDDNSEMKIAIVVDMSCFPQRGDPNRWSGDMPHRL